MNIGKAYRSAQLCDLIGQHELSAEQRDVCETQMPLSTAKKVQIGIAGLFSKSVTIQAETLGLVLLWKNYIYTRNGSWWACIAHSMGTIGKYTVPLPANFNYPRVIRGLSTSAHSDVLRGHLYLYRCPCWLRNQLATWPWRRGGHLCQVVSGDYIITSRNTASFAQLPVYLICWTSVNKIGCWTRLLTSFNCEYGVEWMVDL